MSSRKNLINALFLTVQPLLLNALSIPATAYIIRQLGPTGYGQWATAASIVATLTFLTHMGLRPQFVRRVAQDPDAAADALSHQLGLRLTLTLAAVAISLAIGVGLGYSHTILMCVAVTAAGMLMITVTTTLVDLLQGFQYIRAYAAINFAAGLVLTTATVVAAWQESGPVGLCLAYLAGPFTSMLLLSAFVRRRLGVPMGCRLDGARILSLFRESGAWSAATFLESVRDRLEQLALPRLVGLPAMGFFTAGSMPVDRLVIVPDSLASAFFPSIARSAQNDPEEAAREIRRLTIITFAVCLASAVLLFYLAAPIAQILFPKSPATCQKVLQITVWALPLLALHYPLGMAMTASGRQSSVAYSNGVGTLISVVLSMGLMLKFGLVGACWSYVFRTAVPTLLLLPAFSRAFPGVLRRIPLPQLLWSGGAMAVLLHFVIAQHDGAATLLVDGVGIVAATGVYVGMLVALGVIRRAELQALLTRRLASQTK